MPAITLGVPAGKTSGKYLYSHNNSTSLALNTFGAAVSGFTVIGTNPATYFPGALNLFDTLQPLSAYILLNSDTITINNDNTQVFPATYTLRPGLNMVTVDRNALSALFTDIFKETVTAGNFVTGQTYTIVTVGSTNFTAIGASSNTVGVQFVATGPGSGNGTALTDNINKIRIIYGTYDGTDPGVPVIPGNRFNIYGVYTPDAGLGGALITSFQPGSAYLVSMKSGQTITFQYARKNQYIITDSGNTPPTGPGFIITTESGDRLTTGQEG